MAQEFVYSDYDPQTNTGHDPHAGQNWLAQLSSGMDFGFHASAEAQISHASRPTASSPAPEQVLYLQEPGTGNAVSPLDINQNGIGDCFLLSAIGEIARVDPSYISNHLIQSNGNGTETLNLYEGSNGRAVNIYSQSFAATTVTVHNSFASDSVNSGSGQATYDNQAEIWPQVIENGYAQLNGGYGSISNGGYDLVAMETLTGKIAQYHAAGATTLHQIRNLAPKSIVEFDTPNSSGLAYNLVGDHAYMFDGLESRNNHVLVKLLNPWGVDEPKLVPWAAVAHTFQGITIGHV